MLRVILIWLLLSQHAFAFLHKISRHLAAPGATGDIPVNVYTTNHQQKPSVAMLTDGKVVIVWQSYGQTGINREKVYAKVHNIDGTVLKLDFLVSTLAINDSHQLPKVAPLIDGGFIIAWQSQNNDWSVLGVYAQRFNSDGTTRGINFQVKTWTGAALDFSYLQVSPSAAGLVDGGFVITWQSKTLISQGTDIYAQRYRADGTTQGGDFMVNTYTADNQQKPDITALANGGFVITWMSEGRISKSDEVYFQRYDANGNPEGTETMANTYVESSQDVPSIAELAYGKFVVVWTSRLQDLVGTTQSNGIYGQIFNADGTKSGVEFRVNTQIAENQDNPSIAALPDGSFIVVWQSAYQDSDGWGVYAQLFGADGAPSGTEFRINVQIAGSQYYPGVSVLPTGYIVVWQDGLSYLDIKARWFACPNTSPILYNNDCLTSCPSAVPFRHKNSCFRTCPRQAPNAYNLDCFLPCPRQAPYLHNKVCYAPTEVLEGVTEMTQTTSKVIQAAALVVSAIKFSSPTAVWFNCLSEIIMYIRYLRINYPQRLQYIIDQPEPELVSFEFISEVSEKLEAQLTFSNSVPENFEKYDFHSSFLVNFLSSILFLLAILLIIIITWVFSYATKTCKKTHSFSLKFKQAMKWNYMLAYFTGYFADIALASSLQFGSAQFETSLDIVSVIACVIVNIMVLVVILLMINIIAKLRQAKQQSKSSSGSRFKKLKANLKEYQVVFESFKDKSFLQQGYMIFFVIKLYIFYAIVGYLYNYPLIQTILINILGVFTLVHLCWKRPFKERLELVSNIAQEFVLQVVHICVFIIAYIEAKELDADETKIFFSDLIIVCNAIFTGIGIIYFGLAIIGLLKDLYLWIKSRASNPKLGVQSASLPASRKKRDTSLSRSEDIHNNSANDSSVINDLIHSPQYKTKRQTVKTSKNNFYEEEEEEQKYNGSLTPEPANRLNQTGKSKYFSDLKHIRSNNFKNISFPKHNSHNQDELPVRLESSNLRPRGNDSIQVMDNSLNNRFPSQKQQRIIKKKIDRPFHLPIKR